MAIATREHGGLMALVLVGLVAGCASPTVAPGFNDPFESTNRAWFEHNMALSGALTGGDEPAPAVAPVTDATTVVAPAPHRSSRFRRIVGNFGGNLGQPSVILNDLLQVRPDRAVENTLRFVINTTVGLGGLFDPAGHMGIHGRSTDFGETLHRWGAGEGAYMVLPVFGPSTERDTAGLVVDAFINPLRFVLPQPESSLTSIARIGGRLADAAEYSDILDANVINTADPYAQARLLYLQTRRYHLGIEAEDEIIDPYADF
ncbi:MlaA family lipoprotein [Pararhodobacter zhoushanensis]|uniref:VacJ family lipoprotein n=1 Tax=Pararhodobacter zhoushanensis TaxID=2479545 RepID=A0ABT3GVK8_9RHOB|nr:VacJ family lipoprotein [Pararhodobacter zhoushanensis]MCW1931539.1 VacJ family lipoprotein [Pararhodobacter zhoushanensis]